MDQSQDQQVTKNRNNKDHMCVIAAHGHSQRWGNVHVVEAVPLLKECVVVETMGGSKT